MAPGFVDRADPEGPDGRFGTADDGLRLAASSPAIDAAAQSDVADVDQDGDRGEAVPLDVLGNARNRGMGPDVGAYERP